MPLTIDIHQHTNSTNRPATTVFLHGSLDTGTAPQLEQQLKSVLDSATSDVVFDLARLEFISSAGLRVFAAARKCLQEHGGQASFIHLQPQIQKVFEII